jgi:hypothetical protein
MCVAAPELTRTRRRPAGFWPAAWALFALVAAPVLAAGPEAPAAAEPTSSATADAPLSQRQQQINQRMARLEAQMLKLARLLAEKEPGKAEKLRTALQRQGEADVRRRLEEIVALLDGAQLSEADATQAQVIRTLEEMLTALQDAAPDLDRKRQERERILRLRQEVQRLYDQQTDTLFRTREAAADRAFAEQLAEQAAALEKLAEQQAALRNGRTPAGESQDSAESPAPRMPTDEELRQAEVAQATLEKETADAAARLSESRDKVDEAASRRALEAAEKAVAEARERMAAAREAMKSAKASAPEGNTGSPQQKEGEQAGDSAQIGTQEQSGVSESAEGAEKSTESPAQQAQKQAEEALRRAIARLRDESRRVADRRSVRGIERSQRGHERAAGEIEDQFRQDEPGREGGGQSQNGQQRMSQARRQMQQAADRLGEENAKDAEQRQEEALQQLQETLNELSDALRQTREQEMEEALGALETRIRAILARQEQLREALVPLHQKATLTRADELSLAELSAGQTALAQETRAVRQLLVDEGTTVLMPELVANIVEDMRNAADRLAGLDASAATIQRIDDILAALREILGAIEQRREDMQQQKQSGQQQQGGNQNPALLPGSAELKLVRAAQLRINTETRALPAEAPPERYQTLARRQARLIELTRRMNEKQ